MRGFACLRFICRDYSTATRCHGARVHLVSVLEKSREDTRCHHHVRLPGIRSLAVAAGGLQPTAFLAGSDALVSFIERLFRNTVLSSLPKQPGLHIF